MAKSDRSNSAKLRKETQKRAAAKYGNRAFKGTDPFSKTAATLFSIPGTLAQGFSDVASGRRKVSLGDIAGVVAPAALAAGGMAVARTGAGRKVIKKTVKLATPKSKRFSDASLRLYGASASGRSKAQYAAEAEQRGIDSRVSEYKRRVDAARSELGYSPGEPVQRAVTGTDSYSGSSYRIGRGVPRVPEGTNDLLNNSSAQGRVYSLNRRANEFKGFKELEEELRRKFRANQQSKRNR